MANDCIPFKRPGEDITGHATAAVTGKRFLRISANRTSGPGLSNTAEGSVYSVAPAAAGGEVIGVAKYDAPLNSKVGVIRGGIVPVTAGAALTAGQAVQSDGTGQAIPLAAGIRCGIAMSGASGGQDAEIALQLA